MRTFPIAFVLGFIVAVMMTGTGCETTAVQVGNTAVEIESPVDSRQSDAVCDPFGESESAGGRENGLTGKLFYLNPEQPRYTTVLDYILNGQTVNVDLFFNQLNVPTRPFDQGFLTQNGTILTTPKGDTLYEWFAVHFESEIRLSRHDNAGLYQFALMSDDGAVVKMKGSDGSYEMLVNNDGTHPSRLACATQHVTMAADTSLPVKIDYYQGPRYHIALMLLWRQVDENTDLADVACGKSGNDYFFDSTKTPQVAQPAWLGLLSRGWKVLNAQNYFLPNGPGSSPCTGNCFTDRYVNPTWNTFTLSHGGANGSTVKVTVDGVEVQATYDATLNLVFIPGMPQGAKEVKIGYCLKEPGTGDGGSGGGGGPLGV